MKNSDYLLNRVFLFALFLLLFNDCYLKYAYPSFLSGKLSDLSGIIVFVFFFAFLLGERFKALIFIASTLLFCWWKSDFSSTFIHHWNDVVSFYPIERVIDYTDLFCLFVLVPVYFYTPKAISLVKKRWALVPVLLLTVFAISATSKGGNFDVSSPGNTKLYIIQESFKIKRMTYAEFLQHLALSNLKVEKRSDVTPPAKPSDYHFYILRNFEIKDGIIVESMHIAVREKNRSLKVLIQDVTLFDPPDKPEKEVRELLTALFEDFFAKGK